MRKALAISAAAALMTAGAPAALAFGANSMLPSSQPVWILPYGQVEPMSFGIPNIILYKRCPSYRNLEDPIFGTKANWQAHWPQLGRQHVIMSKAGLPPSLMGRINAKFQWAYKEITLIRQAEKRATDAYNRTNNLKYGNDLGQYRKDRMGRYNGELAQEERHVRTSSISYAVGAIKNYRGSSPVVHGENGQLYRDTPWNRYLKSKALYGACPSSPYLNGNMPMPQYDYTPGASGSGGGQ